PSVFCIPGIIILLFALVLSILVTISLPTIHPFDIARVDFNDGLGTISNAPSNVAGEFRFGIWGYCYQTATTSGFDCIHTGHGYSVVFSNQAGGTETIGASWTRGLAVHAVACVVVGIAFLMSFSEHVTVTLIASLVSFLAALLTLIAFACDIALFAWVKHQMSNLNISESTYPGPAFWMTLVTFILLLLAGCTVCFGHRRER
ncbi:pali-domain-containing protein, partial [Calocera viscosa TUFC12733]